MNSRKSKIALTSRENLQINFSKDKPKLLPNSNPGIYRNWTVHVMESTLVNQRKGFDTLHGTLLRQHETRMAFTKIYRTY